MPKLTVLSCIAALAPTVASAGTQSGALTGVEEAVLTSFDGQPGDGAGQGVALCGDLAIVLTEHATSTTGGGAYLYSRSGTQWSFDEKLRPDYGDEFRPSVATDGRTIAIGALLDLDTSIPNEGVYVFRFIAGAWMRTDKIESPDLRVGDSFGVPVDVDGDTLVVGAPGDDELGLDEGSVYVYERNRLGVWQERTKLFGTVGLYKSRFGLSVAIDGEHLAIGEPYYADDIVTITNDGIFHTYRRGAENWVPSGSVRGAVGSKLGTKVAIDGTTLAVSAPSPGLSHVGSGFVNVYTWDGDKWNQRDSFTSSDHYPAQGFGYSLSVSENRIAVCGASRPMYVFAPSRDGEWSEVARVTTNQNAQLRTCALDGDRLVAGDLFFHESTGRAHVFRLETALGMTFCTGDGASGACPCGNESRPGEGGGCRNSTGDGGRLVAYGSTSLSNDDQVAVVSYVPPRASTILVAATIGSLRGAASSLGDGLRCLGGGSTVHFLASSTNEQGQVAFGPGFAAHAGWSFGETWTLQAVYRDETGSPCGSRVNTTNARAVFFTP